jgi:hypothetical protein
MVDDSYRGYRNDPHGRSGAGSPEPSTDPLTELARLIGQSDPFGDRNRRANGYAGADWRNDPQQPAYPDESTGYDERYGAASDQAPQYGQHAGYDGAQQHGHHGANGGDPYAVNDPGHYAPHNAEQAYGNEQAYGSDQPHGGGPAYGNYPQHDGAGYGDPQGNPHGDPHGYGDAQGYGGAPYQQEPQPHYAQSHDGAYDDPQQDAPPNLGPPPYFGADPQAGRPDAYYDEAPAPRRRGGLITTVALVGLAVIGTAGAFAYRAVVAGGPPPLITRDVRPDKVAPPAQSVDNKQPDRVASIGNEQMAPPPEQPIDVAVTPQPSAAQTTIPMTPPAPVASPFATQVAAPLTTQSTPPLATQATPPAPAPAAAPRKIHTVRISADQESGGAALAPRSANAPLSLVPENQTAPPPRNVAPAPAQPLRTTALAPAPAAPRREASGGPGYYVQVSAQKSEDEARSSYRGIQAKYASVLHDHAPVFRRKDLGSKGVFYGAQIGPFSHEGAIDLCKQLKSAGGSCMIQKN